MESNVKGKVTVEWHLPQTRYQNSIIASTYSLPLLNEGLPQKAPTVTFIGSP